MSCPIGYHLVISLVDSTGGSGQCPCKSLCPLWLYTVQIWQACIQEGRYDDSPIRFGLRLQASSPLLLDSVT